MTRFGVLFFCQKSSEDILQINCLPGIYPTMLECLSAASKLDIVENSITKRAFFKIMKNAEIVKNIVSPTEKNLYGFLRLSEDLQIISCTPELQPDLTDVIQHAVGIHPRSEKLAYFKALNDDAIVRELHVQYCISE